MISTSKVIAIFLLASTVSEIVRAALCYLFMLIDEAQAPVLYDALNTVGRSVYPIIENGEWQTYHIP